MTTQQRGRPALWSSSYGEEQIGNPLDRTVHGTYPLLCYTVRTFCFIDYENGACIAIVGCRPNFLVHFFDAEGSVVLGCEIG